MLVHVCPLQPRHPPFHFFLLSTIGTLIENHHWFRDKTSKHPYTTANTTSRQKVLLETLKLFGVNRTRLTLISNEVAAWQTRQDVVQRYRDDGAWGACHRHWPLSVADTAPGKTRSTYLINTTDTFAGQDG